MESAPEFSLVRGDFFFRLQRRLGLIPATGLGLARRALFWSLFSWLPIAVWAALFGPGIAGAGEPLMAHFAIHARLLLAVPLLILAEAGAHKRSTRLLPAFVESGAVPPSALARLQAVVAATSRLRDATLPGIVVLGIVAAITTTSQIVSQVHEIEWAAPARSGGLGFGAYWYLYVGRSVFLVMLFVWIWRLVVLGVLLRRIAKLDLALVPTHPDRTGGLALLEQVPAAFAPVVLALGVVVAARWIHDAIYHQLAIGSIRVPMIAFVVITVVLFLLPLGAFIGPLARAKRRALHDYGVLVARHGRLVHQRWIEGKPTQDDLLDAPEIGPVADTAAIYQAVRAMRPVPVTAAAILPLALAAALPMIAVLSVYMPIKEILAKLLKAVV